MKLNDYCDLPQRVTTPESEIFFIFLDTKFGSNFVISSVGPSVGCDFLYPARETSKLIGPLRFSYQGLEYDGEDIFSLALRLCCEQEVHAMISIIIYF